MGFNGNLPLCTVNENMELHATRQWSLLGTQPLNAEISTIAQISRVKICKHFEILATFRELRNFGIYAFKSTNSYPKSFKCRSSSLTAFGKQMDYASLHSMISSMLIVKKDSSGTKAGFTSQILWVSGLKRRSIPSPKIVMDSRSVDPPGRTRGGGLESPSWNTWNPEEFQTLRQPSSHSSSYACTWGGPVMWA